MEWTEREIKGAVIINQGIRRQRVRAFDLLRAKMNGMGSDLKFKQYEMRQNRINSKRDVI